jgi:hypothetical protein
MLYFPQLQSGATVQYPFVKRRAHRTAVNNLVDGRAIKLSDPGAMLVGWDLEFGALTNQERGALEEFFGEVEGRLGEFTFLDPADNLLLWSENLDATAWMKESLLALNAGATDPSGGTRATRIFNAGIAPQALQQTIDAPGWFHYCFSLYVRSEAPTSVEVFRFTGEGTEAKTCRLDSGWRQLALSGKREGAGESVTFGIRFNAGATVDVHGLMAEAQPAASAYRRTTSRSGVYRRARFGDDLLTMTSEGPEQHACRVRIVAPAAG